MSCCNLRHDVVIRSLFLALVAAQMEAELGGYSRDNTELTRQLEHMELKVRVTQREIMKERQQVRCSSKQISDRGCDEYLRVVC